MSMLKFHARESRWNVSDMKCIEILIIYVARSLDKLVETRCSLVSEGSPAVIVQEKRK